MSGREKKLLFLLGFVALVVGGLMGAKLFYVPKHAALKARVAQAQQEIQSAKSILETASLYQDEMEWLSQHEPEPNTVQDSQTNLQAFAESSAKSNRLEVRSQALLASIETEGNFYHRARLELLVTGKEIDFYRWLVTINNPGEFRKVTFLRMNPKRDDNTQIEAKINVEQWFVPAQP